MNRGSRTLNLAKMISREICRRQLIFWAISLTISSAKFALSSFISPAFVSTVKCSSAKSAFSSVELLEYKLAQSARKILRRGSFHYLKGTPSIHRNSKGAHASNVQTTKRMVHIRRSTIILKTHVNIAQ
jgi:hypothetical protein